MNLRSWFQHTVAWAPFTGRGEKGDPLFGARRSLACRLEKRHRLVRTSEGREVVCGHELVTDRMVGLQDRFWFPAILGEAADDARNGDAGRTPVAISVATHKASSAGIVTVSFE